MNSFSTIGTIRYSEKSLIADVDQGLADFYLGLIPKYLDVRQPMFSAHVSIVRMPYEIVPNMSLWGKHRGEEIVVWYSNQVENDEVYYWLDVQCERLKEIRIELGLPPSTVWHNQFHITVGNTKHKTT